jgi:hypothetical protein
MGFHAWNEDKVTSANDFFFHLFIGILIIRDHRETATQDEHRLDVEMVVNRDLAAGTYGEESESTPW